MQLRKLKQKSRLIRCSKFIMLDKGRKVGRDSAYRFNHPPSNGVEEIPVQISHLPEARGIADEAGDDGTNDLLVSQVLRVNELQSWFIVTHLIDEPLVIASDE